MEELFRVDVDVDDVPLLTWWEDEHNAEVWAIDILINGELVSFNNQDWEKKKNG